MEEGSLKQAEQFQSRIKEFQQEHGIYVEEKSAVSNTKKGEKENFLAEKEKEKENTDTSQLTKNQRKKLQKKKKKKKKKKKNLKKKKNKKIF